MPETRAEPPRDVTDEQLLTQAGHGDLKAFEALVRRHERAILNYVFRLGASPDVAEDVFRGTICRLFEQLDQLPLSDRPDLWLLRTARKLFGAQAAVRPESESAPGPAAPPPDESVPGESTRTETSVRRRFEPWIRTSLAAIPRQRREALILKVYHGLNYRDIARVTGVPPGTVYYWIDISLAEIAKQV